MWGGSPTSCLTEACACASPGSICPAHTHQTEPGGNNPTKHRAHMDILGEYKMGHGDLYIIPGDVNARFAHGIPYDPEVNDLRVSIVFRSVTRYGYNAERKTRVDYKTGKEEPINPDTERLRQKPAFQRHEKALGARVAAMNRG